jgi:hypothetical protein
LLNPLLNKVQTKISPSPTNVKGLSDLLRYIHGGDKNGLAGEDEGCFGADRESQGETDDANG